MESLGPIYIALGESAKARRILERSVEILEKEQKSGNLELTLALLKLGAACGNLGLKQEAVANIERASRIMKDLTGPRPRFLIDFWTASSMVYPRAKREAKWDGTAVKTLRSPRSL
jgi:tetratricopeptide (TPR) repeat protein